MKEQALKYLRVALNNPDADFHDGQWESIDGLLNQKRMLVVQRTGWGKSMVYFMATRLLRDQGKGPTLLVSPLLSLMRNQLDSAQRMGVRAATINSTNANQWDEIVNGLNSNTIDVLLISPERLSNEKFRQTILPLIASTVGLFVIDEAHCISDWGHDFRPDYRLISRVLGVIPPNVSVLATTATANNRVIADIVSQLGDDIDIIRGELVRDSLQLQNINMPNPAVRMSWLVDTIQSIEGSGIVYTLTQRDAEKLTEWFKINKIEAEAYHSGIPDNEDGSSRKEELECKLINNEIKVLVATVALGMGFDKPDLGFTIHYQRPSSVVHYYQQVGRAGRAIDKAYGILLCGEEDDHIADFFIKNAFPSSSHITDLLKALDTNDGLSIPSLEKYLNLSKSQIEKIVKFLTVESPSPIVKKGTKWYLTATGNNYTINQNSIDLITQIRKNEQVQMQNYMNEDGCLMLFLQNALDDSSPQACGKCIKCMGSLLSESYDDELATRASLFLRRSYQPIQARKQWPGGNPLPKYSFSGTRSEDLMAEEGRALCLWRDAGWGELVVDGKYNTRCFDERLVDACLEMITEWNPTPMFSWVTCMPSRNNPTIVPDFAKRLADKLGVPFLDYIEIIGHKSEQKYMENSFQQANNLDGVFKVNMNVGEYAPCLLIDDIVASGWTFTVASALLRQVGVQAVHPLALALNSPRMN